MSLFGFSGLEGIIRTIQRSVAVGITALTISCGDSPQSKIAYSTGDGGGSREYNESQEEKDCMLRTFYEDNDNDGFGNPRKTVQSCFRPQGNNPKGKYIHYVDNDEDCDDSNNLIHPDAEELCDRIDNDCDGRTDEDHMPQSVCEKSNGACRTTGTYVCSDKYSSYCNAPEPRIPSDEICDGVDNDCDEEVDNVVLEERVIAEGPGWATSRFTQPLWSPDGMKVALRGILDEPGYFSYVSSFSPVYLAELDGSGPYLLASIDRRMDPYPSGAERFRGFLYWRWAPASQILFTLSNGIENPATSEILSLNPDTGVIQSLGFGSDPVLQSRDSATIAYSCRYREGICFMDEDGNNLETVLDGTFVADWSPDNSFLIFTQVFGSTISFLKYSLEDRGTELLYQGMLCRSASPAYIASAQISPDGNFVLFNLPSGLMLKEIRTGEEITLSSEDCSWYTRSSSWSPTSDWILHGHSIIDLEGTVQHTFIFLPSCGGYESSVESAWSPAGDKVLIYGIPNNEGVCEPLVKVYDVPCRFRTNGEK